MWMHCPKKQVNVKITEALKHKVQTEADRLVESALKPAHIQPSPDNARFNYIVDIYTKWGRGYFYFYAKYNCPDPNATLPSFDIGIARMKYIGGDSFSLSYMRHTGKWHEVFYELSLDECLAVIKDEPYFLSS